MTTRASGSLAAWIVAGFGGEAGFRLDVTLTVPAGVTIVFGPSGAGKTTLLDCVAGLRRPLAGRVELGGRVLFDSETGADVAPGRRGIGYVFQSLALFPHLSVQKNVEYGLQGLSASGRARKARELLEAFRISHLATRRPAEISGGERQRVALARTLVTEPQALLLDEPLAALDTATKTRILDDLRAWNAQRPVPVLYVTHSHREAFALGERMIVLEEGRVAAEGSPHEVLQMPRTETMAQISGFENIFDAAVAATHAEQGTMTCRLARSAVELEVPLGRFTPGEAVRVAIRAGDILLAGEPPARLSARNVIRGRIASLEQTGTRVVAKVESDGVAFLADLTPRARDELALAPGRDTWLVIKSYSCFLLQPGGNGV